MIVGDLLDLIAGMGYQVQDPGDGVIALRAQAQLMLAGLVRLADQLDRRTSALLSGAGVSDEALREAALSSLERWRDNPAEGESAVAAVIAGEWIQQLGELASELEDPVSRAVEGARVPWWR